MNRDEKIAAVEQMNEGFRRNPHAVLASFRGLTVNQANKLRRAVQDAGGSYTVVKNRLAKRAAAGTPMEEMSARFSGPCALALHESDPVVLAKTLTEFAKNNPQLEVLAGLVEARTNVDAEGVQRLAKLPALPELQAQLLALVQTPATMLVRLLNTPGGQLARVVDARCESQEGSSEE